jgi:hypothetical protein
LQAGRCFTASKNAAGLKAQAGTRDEVANGSGNQNLGRLGVVRDLADDFDGGATDGASFHLALADVQACTNAYADPGRMVNNGAGAADRAGWTIE